MTQPQQLEGEAPALGVATAGLEALGKLLSFFKSDFTMGGTEIAFDNSMLLFAVAGAIQQKGCNNLTVHTPSIYSPTAKTDAIAALSKELLGLMQLRDVASQTMKLSEQARTNDQKLLAAAKPEDKGEIQIRIDQATARIEQLKAVAVMHDTFVNSLTAPDAAGAVPALGLAEQIALDSAISDVEAAIVLVRLEKAGGGYYVKKNMWTGLGAMPFYQMGGAVVSYAILAGPTGAVLKAGVVPVHGGYMKASEVQKVTTDQRTRLKQACK